MSTETIWKVIPFAPKYEVSNFGDVRKAETGVVLKRHTCSVERDYPSVTLDINSKRKRFRCHIYVTRAFLGYPKMGQVVRHLDGNGSNPRLGNLKYGTPTENAADKKRHGTENIGEKNGRSKLKTGDVPEIRRRLKDGENKSSIGRAFGVHRSIIYAIATGKKWAHV